MSKRHLRAQFMERFYFDLKYPAIDQIPYVTIEFIHEYFFRFYNFYLEEMKFNPSFPLNLIYLNMSENGE